MTASFRIRPACIEDADAIARVHHQGWRETYPGLMPPELLERVSLEYRLDLWRRIIRDLPPRGARFVAEMGGAGRSAAEIVGVAQCGPARDAELNARWEIWMLYVLREAQRAGVGSALMRAMFDHMVAQDEADPVADRSVGLWVLKGNGRAIGFYAKHGAMLTGAAKREDRMGVVIEDVAMRWTNAGAG